MQTKRTAANTSPRGPEAVNMVPPEVASNEVKVFYPRIGAAILRVFLLSPFLALAVFMSASKVQDQMIVGWFMIILFGGFFIYSIGIIALRYPRIVLTPEGVSHYGFIKRLTYKWSEIGPFTSHTVFTGVLSRARYAVALTDSNHDMLTLRGESTTVARDKTDIGLPLMCLNVGRTDEAAENFATELNSWRDQYGSPEIDLMGADPEVLFQQYKSRNKRRAILGWSFLFIVILILIYIMSLEVNGQAFYLHLKNQLFR